MGTTHNGQCVCGAVQYKVSGAPLFNVYDHCKACTRFRGSSPVHLYAVKCVDFAYTKGQDKLRVGKGLGSLRHTYCADCGSCVTQQPEGGDFQAVFPHQFHIQKPDPTAASGLSLKMPKELMPQMHINYESRIFDCSDDLPKFEGFPGSKMLCNDGAAA